MVWVIHGNKAMRGIRGDLQACRQLVQTFQFPLGHMRQLEIIPSVVLDDLVVCALESQEETVDVLQWANLPSLDDTVDDFNGVFWAASLTLVLDGVEQSQVTDVCVCRVGQLLEQDDLVQPGGGRSRSADRARQRRYHGRRGDRHTSTSSENAACFNAGRVGPKNRRPDEAQPPV